MSKDVAAAFLRMLARSSELRDEIARLGARHGFRFSPDDLTDLGLEDLFIDRDEGDDRLSDRGFGPIESPP